MKKTKIYRQQKDENLFEEELTIDALSELGAPLEQLSSLVDFEMFRSALEDVFPLVNHNIKTFLN